MIHYLEKFSVSAQKAQKFDKNPDTLMTVNSTTTPPPMCPSKKNYWPLAPKKETLLQESPAKYDSEGLFVITKSCETCKKKDCLL